MLLNMLDLNEMAMTNKIFPRWRHDDVIYFIQTVLSPFSKPDFHWFTAAFFFPFNAALLKPEFIN